MQTPTVTLDASSLLTPQTGIGRYTEQLVRALLARREANIRLLCSYRPGAAQTGEAIASAFSPLGATVIRNPVPNRVLHASWELLNWPPAELYAGATDVFHATNHLAPPARRAAVVATIHDLTAIRFPEWHAPYQRLVAKYLPKSIKRTRLILADSRSTANDLMSYLDVPEEKIRVVPLAAAPHFDRPPSAEALLAVRARYGLAGGYFLFVGTLEPRKNLGVLLLAYQKLPREIQEAHPLVLVGSRGWEDEKLITMIDALKAVRWLGRVPDADLPALMAEATAFVYPSRFEGFGLPVLEAMAAGAPVVTSCVSSLPEVTGEGPEAAGLLVEPEDVEGIARAMTRLAEDQALREALIRRGRARAATFSWARTAELTMAAYREVLS
ncbi:MAG: glycosyltransferase family 4 protein [Candidatus Sericytochromatia bacterium]